MKTPIEQRFETNAGRLSEIRDCFAAQVVRWAYSSMEIWSWSYKRQWVTDDNLLPDAEGALYACGYDVNDQPVVLHHFDYETVYEPSTHRIPLKTVWCEEFISHREDTLEVLRFVRGELERLSQLRFQGLRQIEDESVIQGVYQHTLIHYEGSKKKLQQSFDSKGRVFFEINFGPHGEQSYFRVSSDGRRFQLYQPLPKGITVKSLKETVRRRLVELIPELVSAAAIGEPIYCVALAYDEEGNDALPPVVGIGMESERQRWKVECGKKAKDFVWNPAEFYHYEKSHTQLSDDALEEACDYLNGKWAEGGSTSQAAKLLMETAAALNRTNWPLSVQRTQDFVVYATGLEGGGLRRSLKAGLTPDKLAALKANGLL